MRKNNYFFKIPRKGTLLFIFSFYVAISCFSQDKLTISYLGNMGVLIGNEKQAVLIDGFHKEYGPEYLFPPDSLIKKVISGVTEEFGNIDIAIATHHHKDHFDPAYFRSFLNFNKSSIAILSPQIKEILNIDIKKPKVDWHRQIKISDYDGKAHSFHHEGIEVKSFQGDHVNPSRHRSIENTAYVINIKGVSILHVGDTNWDVVEKHLITHKELLKHLDVAILPYWMLLEEESIELFERLINSASLIATHIPPDFIESNKKSISNNFQNVMLFTKIGQAMEVLDIRIR